MSLIAVFVEPEGSLGADILQWKARVEAEYPGQPYCGDPPHCTLICAAVREEGSLIAALKECAAARAPFSSEIRSTDVFWNDPVTGGHTLYFRLPSSPAIFDLQRAVAVPFGKFGDRVPPPDFVRREPSLTASYATYGFPFVGSHWLPHFTIASLRAGSDTPLIREFLALKPSHLAHVAYISIWRVNGSEHSLLERLKLG